VEIGDRGGGDRGEEIEGEEIEGEPSLPYLLISLI
jgi:hypothetical protein